jgi:hypothetical protein
MKWAKGKSKHKIIILGGRSGTSLVHKCLLLTGKINWGLWSLEDYESEPQIKIQIWSQYQKVNVDRLLPKFYWEIAKSPDIPFILKDLMERFKMKFIVLERDIDEQIQSHIRAWGEGFMDIYNVMQNFKDMLESEFGFIPDDIKTVLRLYFLLRYKLQEEALTDYPKELVLRVKFHDLMNDYETEMKRISDFLDINFDIYKGLWKEMRKIKHMDTGSDLNKWLEKK